MRTVSEFGLNGSLNPVIFLDICDICDECTKDCAYHAILDDKHPIVLPHSTFVREYYVSDSKEKCRICNGRAHHEVKCNVCHYPLCLALKISSLNWVDLDF